MLSWQSNNQRPEFIDSKCCWRGWYRSPPLKTSIIGFLSLSKSSLSLQKKAILSPLKALYYCFFDSHIVEWEDFVEEKQKAISLFCSYTIWVSLKVIEKQKKKERKLWSWVLREIIEEKVLVWAAKVSFEMVLMSEIFLAEEEKVEGKWEKER